MTARSVAHGTFVIERVFAASPHRVFAAWSSLEAKSQWFGCDPAFVVRRHQMDFRVGGIETNRVGVRGGPIHAFDAVYYEIIPDERIVYAYEMAVGGVRLSVSVATLEFVPEGAGTRFRLTEQGAFLDGHQPPAEREEGTRIGLENLETFLRRPAA